MEIGEVGCEVEDHVEEEEEGEDVGGLGNRPLVRQGTRRTMHNGETTTM
jgi:hypothetical protein